MPGATPGSNEAPVGLLDSLIHQVTCSKIKQQQQQQRQKENADEEEGEQELGIKEK